MTFCGMYFNRVTYYSYCFLFIYLFYDSTKELATELVNILKANGKTANAREFDNMVSTKGVQQRQQASIVDVPFI